MSHGLYSRSQACYHIGLLMYMLGTELGGLYLCGKCQDFPFSQSISGSEE